MATIKRRPIRHWTKTEMQTLRNRQMTAKEKARAIGRTEGAIRQKARDEGFSLAISKGRTGGARAIAQRSRSGSRTGGMRAETATGRRRT